MNLLSTSNIVVDRGNGHQFGYPDLEIKKQDMAALVGPSGSGKTTLLSVVTGLLPPTTGAVKFQGQDIYALPGHDRDRLRGQKIGFVFQTLHLLPSLTLRQNIALASSMSGMTIDYGRLDHLIEQLGLTHRAYAKPQALSQGEQQRAAIARAVLNKPDIIIADEPTSALDRDNANKVIELLKWQAQDTGAALLVATHDERIINQFSKTITIDTARKALAA